MSRFATPLAMYPAIEFVKMLKHWITGFAMLATASLAMAQFDTTESDTASVEITDVVPAAALLTQRGQELAERLRQLRRIEATMGAKHPSRSEVQEQIKAVLEQLQAWSPALSSTSGDQTLPTALPAMNEHDLHQLILRLAAKVEQLETRVATLEKQNQASR